MLQVLVAGRRGKIRQFPQTAAYAPRAVLDLVDDERAGDPALLARKRIYYRLVQQFHKTGPAAIIEDSLGYVHSGIERHQHLRQVATAVRPVAGSDFLDRDHARRAHLGIVRNLLAFGRGRANAVDELSFGYVAENAGRSLDGDKGHIYLL